MSNLLVSNEVKKTIFDKIQTFYYNIKIWKI